MTKRAGSCRGQTLRGPCSPRVFWCVADSTNPVFHRRWAGLKYLEENAKKEGVNTTASGLQYRVLRAGVKPKVAVIEELMAMRAPIIQAGGKAPQIADTCLLNYRGGTHIRAPKRRGLRVRTRQERVRPRPHLSSDTCAAVLQPVVDRAHRPFLCSREGRNSSVTIALLLS